MRYRSLDALRGIAAVHVAAAHAISSSQISFSSNVIKFTPLRLITEPHPSVIFFFVLSGFVLTISLTNDRSQHYLYFLTRRFCRIYLPYAASIFLAVGLCWIIQPLAPPLADWSDWSPRAVLSHLLMTGSREGVQLNGIAWSLIHEMRISIILPLAVIIFSKNSALAVLTAGASSTVAWLLLSGSGHEQFYTSTSVSSALLLTVFYFFPFATGIFIALERDRLFAVFKRRPYVSASMILVALFIAQRSRIHYTGISDVVVSVFAGLIIIFVLNSKYATRILSIRFFQEIGKISYSLYLTHLLVLLTMTHTLKGVASPQWAAAFSAFAMLPVAYLMNFLVERPAIRLGQMIGPKAAPKVLPAVAG